LRHPQEQIVYGIIGDQGFEIVAVEFSGRRFGLQLAYQYVGQFSCCSAERGCRGLITGERQVKTAFFGLELGSDGPVL
jgi:hypothetical protein